MYFPRHQIRILEQGNIPQLEDMQGNPIEKQQVIQTSTGRYFEVDNNALDTGNFLGLEEFRKKIEDTPKPLIEEPLQRQDINYSKQTIKRYFVKNITNGNIVEVKHRQYRELLEQRERFYIIGTIEWRIQGPIKDNILKGRLLKGAESENREKTQELNKVVKGIVQKITDFTKFVQEISVVDGKEIDTVPQKDAFYIPAPSKKVATT